MLHLFSISGVVRAAEKIVANSLKIVGVCKVVQSAKPLNLEQQIDSFRFFIMVDELRDDLVHQLV